MLKAVRDGDKVRVGDSLSPTQIEALKRADVVSAKGFDVEDDEQFQKVLNGLNEEIEESYPRVVEPGPVPRKLPTSPVARPNVKQMREQAERVREETKPRSRIEAKAEEIKNVMPEEPELDLDAELDAITREAQGEPEAAPSAPDLSAAVLSTLAKIPGSPTEAQINAWKNKYGQNAVYVIAFGDDEVYVFTPLVRSSWQKLQETIQTLRNQGGMETAQLEEKLKEKVVQYSVLWPRPLDERFFYNSRAGVVPSLYEAIMMQSCFMTPQQTAMLTVSL